MRIDFMIISTMDFNTFSQVFMEVSMASVQLHIRIVPGQTRGGSFKETPSRSRIASRTSII